MGFSTLFTDRKSILSRRKLFIAKVSIVFEEIVAEVRKRGLPNGKVKFSGWKECNRQLYGSFGGNSINLVFLAK